MRGAVVGLVVGAVVARIYGAAIAEKHGIGTVFHDLLMFVLPFPLGGVGVALLRMHRRGMAAIVGPIATYVLGTAMMRVIPDYSFFGFDEMWTTGVWVVAGVLGYAAAAWCVRDRWVAITVTGLLLSVHVIADQVRDPLHEWQRVVALQLSDLPLLAPEMPGYSISHTALQTGESSGKAIKLELSHKSEVGWDSFQLRISSGSSPEAACHSPHDSSRWHQDSVCTPSSDDRWIRGKPPGHVSVFARHGTALVEIKGMDVATGRLVAILDSLRPVTAAHLVKVHDLDP